ncbi:MAG: CAAX farnesyltransferase (FTase) subunit beta [Caeruleum heppii]|nr:MAG: CAAX farnesyltransferase (FTase) subunit beta [Caeruleum heppii]
MVLITLLDLPVELTSTSPAYGKPHRTLTDGLTDYLSRCQTFEGGISGSPGNEAHGAYAFCALACFCMLGQPQKMLSEYVSLKLEASYIPH